MGINEVIVKYCDFIRGKGLVIRDDAPMEAVKVFRDWQENHQGKPDENGMVIIID